MKKKNTFFALYYLANMALCLYVAFKQFYRIDVDKFMLMLLLSGVCLLGAILFMCNDTQRTEQTEI